MIRILLPTLALLIAAGCRSEEQTTTPDTGDGASLGALAQEPAEAQDVSVVKQDAAVGDSVAVYGRLREFTSGYASFILTDKKMRHCAEIPGDNCPTPWDYCCESSTEVAENSLVVEFRDEDGAKPRKMELEGHEGLEKLADVVVSGTVVEVKEGNVIVAADGFFVRS